MAVKINCANTHSLSLRIKFTKSFSDAKLYFTAKETSGFIIYIINIKHEKRGKYVKRVLSIVSSIFEPVQHM